MHCCVAPRSVSHRGARDSMQPNSWSGLLRPACLAVLWMTYCYLPLCLAPWRGFLGKLHKPHYHPGVLCHLGSRHVSKAFESGRVRNVNTRHWDSPLTSNNTPLSSKRSQPRCGLSIPILPGFSSRTAGFSTKKADFRQRVYLVFPTSAPHQMRNTRAIHNLNWSPCFYIRGSGWILVKPSRNLPLQDLVQTFLCFLMCSN